MPVSPRSPAVKGVGCSRVGISTMELAGTGFGLPRLIPIPAHLHTLKPAHSPWTTYFHSHARTHTHPTPYPPSQPQQQPSSPSLPHPLGIGPCGGQSGRVEDQAVSSRALLFAVLQPKQP